MRSALGRIALIALMMACVGWQSGTAQTVSVSGDPTILRITSAPAGGTPIAVTEASTTYTVTNVAPNGRLTARLSDALPPGMQLRIQVEAPAGAASMGYVTLTASPQEVVAGLSIGTWNALTIIYELTAPASAGVIPQTARIVTLTLGT